MASYPMPSPPPERSAQERRRQQRLGLGLLLSLLGIFLLAILFPTDPSALLALLPIGGAGMLALWVGGVLLGSRSGAR
ncbi:MAG: hypothetical protein ACYCPV_01690 [Thermoplasmata archaeon]